MSDAAPGSSNDASCGPPDLHSAATTGSDTSPVEGPSAADQEAHIIEAISRIYDPEIPVDIYELGLIYLIRLLPQGRVEIDMTLTSPMCPVAESLPVEVHDRVAALAGISDVKVNLVWDPPWNPEMMSEAARLQLNM